MPRTIKRYGSRKLYDTTASEYVSLERVATLIREGEQVEILDNKSGDDVTGVVLAQIIAEEGRNGSGLSSGFLHDLVRMGERVIKRGEETVAEARKNVGEMVGDARRKVREAAPLADVRGEMARLRERLDAIEASLEDETDTPEPPADAG